MGSRSFIKGVGYSKGFYFLTEVHLLTSFRSNITPALSSDSWLMVQSLLFFRRLWKEPKRFKHQWKLEMASPKTCFLFLVIFPPREEGFFLPRKKPSKTSRFLTFHGSVSQNLSRWSRRILSEVAPLGHSRDLWRLWWTICWQERWTNSRMLEIVKSNALRKSWSYWTKTAKTWRFFEQIWFNAAFRIPFSSMCSIAHSPRKSRQPAVVAQPHVRRSLALRAAGRVSRPQRIAAFEAAESLAFAPGFWLFGGCFLHTAGDIVSLPFKYSQEPFFDARKEDRGK